MNLNHLQKLNPDLKLQSVDVPGFTRYGRVLTGYEFSDVVRMAEAFPVPTTTNTYLAEDKATRELPIYGRLGAELYGEMPIQIGFGGGYNLALNALEWHQGNEVNVAVTDFVIMIAGLDDLKDGRLDTSLVRSFYLKKGQAVELYGTTLHYSPCNVDTGVFRMVVVLPLGTNLPLGHPSPNRLLSARNKWLLAHPEASKEIAEGAVVGLTGTNLRLRVE